MANVVVVRPESYVDGSDRIGLRYISLHGISSSFKPNTHKEVLSLKIFYPFAGRLAKNDNEDDESVSFFVDCDGSGVKFVHASATTISVSDVLEPADGTVPDFLTGFFPGNGVRSCDGISESLIAFQVTELKDGVFIGYGSNHMIADGFSFWSFFKAWSEICSTGFHRENCPPLPLRGWFLGGIDYPIRIPISEAVRVVSPTLPDLRVKVFRFTSKNVSELKLGGER